jgi:hypothetical protein
MGFGCTVIHTTMQQCDKDLHLITSGGYHSALCPHKFKHNFNEVQIYVLTQDKQCTRNVTLKRVRVTTVAMEKQ